MQIRLLTNGIELWKWKVWNILSSFDNSCPSFLCPFLWNQMFGIVGVPPPFEKSLPLEFLLIFTYVQYVLLIVECMHIFKFEQNGLCQFCAGLKKWQKDYFIMTRPISTLYGMLSHFGNILSRESCSCETFRLHCSSHDKSPRIWFNNVI